MRSTPEVLLAIDTSTRVVGLSLYTKAQVLHEAVWKSYDHHTVELAPAIAEALKKSGIKAKNLSAIGVATGPGSFTGLRIGLALAKGIAMAQNIPLIGIPTLDALALGQPTHLGAMVAVLKAGRGRLAACWYKATNAVWQPLEEIQVFTVDELCAQIESPTLVCGELTPEEREKLAENPKNAVLASAANCLRRPAFLAELAWQRWKSGQIDDPSTLAPLYLHYKDPIPG